MHHVQPHPRRIPDISLHVESRLVFNIPMRNTRTLSITLPPDMLKRAQSIAKKGEPHHERAHPRGSPHYERRSWWEDVNAYGRSKAHRQGIREQDVDRLVHELRASKRAAKK